jgi:cytochrome c-type biogenesis protein CcmH
VKHLVALTALIACFVAAPACLVSAYDGSSSAEDPAIELRLKKMSNELRCLVCQNQTIADSDAPLAVDLRREIRSMMESGQEDDAIIQYLVDRYGDFIRFRPPLKASTALLWFGPPILIAIAASAWTFALRRRQRAADAPLSDEEQRRLEHVLEDGPD